MAHGSEAARDLRYGRRGGRWATSGQADATSKPCADCGAPMMMAQPVRHMVCCVQAGEHTYGGRCRGCGL